MDKRLPLAMLLSLAVWFFWLKTFPPQPVEQNGADGPPALISNDGQTAANTSESDLSSAVAGLEIPGRTVASEARRETVLIVDPQVIEDGADPRGLWQATFDNKGGVLRELRLGHYAQEVGGDSSLEENWPVLTSSVPTDSPRFAGETGSLLLSADVSGKDLVVNPLAEELWDMELLTENGVNTGVSFKLSPGRGVSFEKRFEVAKDSKSGWEFDFTLTMTNNGGVNSGPRQFMLTPAANVQPALDDRFYIEPRAVAAGPAGNDGYNDGDEEISQDTAEMRATGGTVQGPLEVETPLSFVGSHNKYFAFLMRGADGDASRSMVGATFERLAESGSAESEFVIGTAQLELSVPPAGESRSWHYRVYAGPKAPDTMTADLEDFQIITESDLKLWVFAWIGKLLLGFLSLLEGMTGNFGWAIILMTLCLRACMFPMTRKSQTSMARYQKKMKRVQPKIDAIKEKYKDDRAELNRAQQKLMQEEGIFPPLGGCLPLFLQMPIFFGLFSALRTSFDLRQAPFMGYIQDLSRPDALFPFTVDIPIVHWETFNLLPIIMVVMWVLQQMTMPKPTDPQSARMQKMMMFMPVMMGFFLYNYAAGLSLYMITQSTMGIIEQKVIKKKWPIDDVEVETKKKGCGPLSGTMERLAEKQKQQMAMMEKQRALQAKQKGGKKRKR